MKDMNGRTEKKRDTFCECRLNASPFRAMLTIIANPHF